MITLEPGTEVDRYVIESVLGEGGMAIVYRARHRDLGSAHAIKQMKVTDPAIRERLLREGRLQSGLKHPNVVSVTDMISIGEAPALVMEFVDGPNLAQLLAQFRPSITQCDAIARGILKGVAAAHGHGLVHRDLKPANILIAKTEDEVIPKIADFGLVKLLEGLDDADGITKDGMIMGTPSYMAPEQLDDARAVDERADVFSLGVILYELVCGQPCFKGNHVPAIWLAISQGNFVAPKKNVPTLPDRMVRAIEGALRVDREARISKVSDLFNVWCTDDDGHQVPVAMSTMTEPGVDDVGPMSDFLVSTQPSAYQNFAFEQTKDSYDEASVLGPGLSLSDDMTVPPPVETAPPPSRMRWYAGSLLLCGLVGYLAAQTGADPTPSKYTTQAITQNESPQKPAKSPVSPVPQTTESLLTLPQPATSANRTQFINAQHALLDANYALAENALRGLIERQPDEGQLHTILAVSFFLRDHLVRAAIESDIGARKARDRAGPGAQLARLADRSWREQKNRTVLLPKWANLASVQAANPMIRLTYLIATRAMFSTEDLLKAIDRAQVQFPKMPAFAIFKLRTLYESGQYAAWMKAAQLIHLRFPGHTSCRLALAKAEVRMGRYADALPRLKVALERDASLIEARTLIAKVYLRMGDEAKRTQQLIMAMNDDVPAEERLAFLHDHGIALASVGRLSEAEKTWRFCLTEAQKNGHPNAALSCARAALDAHLWMAPTKAWTSWTNRMTARLAAPSLEVDVQQFHALGLAWFKAIWAARSGDLSAARRDLAHLRSLTSKTSGLNAAEYLERTLRFEIGLLAQDDDATARALAELEKDQAIPDRQPPCSLRFKRGRIAQRTGKLTTAASEFSAILNETCRPSKHFEYRVAATRIRLASVRIGQGKFAEAAELLKAFKTAWPKADPGLTLVEDARRLARLLPTAVHDATP
ncbi:MAG: protein kinase [Myxococcota bacterium]|nr:protein kinase [Myxococcota bacterium]